MEEGTRGGYGKLVPRFNHKMAASYRFFIGASVDIRYVPVRWLSKSSPCSRREINESVMQNRQQAAAAATTTVANNYAARWQDVDAGRRKGQKATAQLSSCLSVE